MSTINAKLIATVFEELPDAMMVSANFACALDFDPSDDRATMTMREMGDALAQNGALIHECRDALGREYGKEPEGARELQSQLNALQRISRGAVMSHASRANLMATARASLSAQVYDMFVVYIARKELSMTSLIISD